MRNMRNHTNPIYATAIALLIAISPFLGLVAAAPQTALAGSTSYNSQTWDTVQGWVQNCQVEYCEGNLIRQRLVLTNNTSDNWTTIPIELVYDFYNGTGQKDAIGIDYMTDFKYGGSAAYDEPPTWW